MVESSNQLNTTKGWNFFQKAQILPEVQCTYQSQQHVSATRGKEHLRPAPAKLISPDDARWCPRNISSNGNHRKSLEPKQVAAVMLEPLGCFGVCYEESVISS